MRDTDDRTRSPWPHDRLTPNAEPRRLLGALPGRLLLLAPTAASRHSSVQNLIASLLGSHRPLVIVVGGAVVAAGTWQLVAWGVGREARWWEEREQNEREARELAAADWPHANEEEDEPEGRAR